MFIKEENIADIVFLFLLIVIPSCLPEMDNNAFEQHCQYMEEQNISNPYIFPIKPGDEEWKKLTSHKAMVDVCQIPQPFLESMCTHDLVETYFNYPLIFIMTAFNNVNDGLDQVRTDFNGFDELINRKGSGIRIVKRYENMDPTGIDSTWTLLEKGFYVTKFWYIEFTLSYDPILGQLTTIEKDELLETAIEKYESKKLDSNYSDMSLVFTIYLISRILDDLNYQPFQEFIAKDQNLQYFLDGYLVLLIRVSDGNMIIEFAKDYLSD